MLVKDIKEELILNPDLVMVENKITDVTGDEVIERYVLDKNLYVSLIKLSSRIDNMGTALNMLDKLVKMTDEEGDYIMEFGQTLPNEIKYLTCYAGLMIKSCNLDCKNIDFDKLLGYLSVFTKIYNINDVIGNINASVDNFKLSISSLESYETIRNEEITMYKNMGTPINIAPIIDKLLSGNFAVAAPVAAPVAVAGTVPTGEPAPITVPVVSTPTVPTNVKYTRDNYPETYDGNNGMPWPKYGWENLGIDEESPEFNTVAAQRAMTNEYMWKKKGPEWWEGLTKEKREMMLFGAPPKKENEKETATSVEPKKEEPKKEEPKKEEPKQEEAKSGDSLDIDQRKKEAADNNKILADYNLGGFKFV